MKNIVIHGATYNSNFGDVLFADLFYKKYINDGFNVDLLQVNENGRPLCDFVRNELNYYNILSYEEALKKDALIIFSGGMFGQPQREQYKRNLMFKRYNTFIKPLLDFQNAGKKTFIIGVGGSIIYDSYLRNKTIQALKNANYVSFRNQETLDYFKQFGINNAELTTDTAQVIQNIKPKYLSNKKTILIHIHTNIDKDVIFCNNVIKGIKQFINEHTEYDIIVTTCQLVNNLIEYPSVKLLNDDYIIYNYTSIYDLCSIIAGVDIVITPALHVGIIGASLGKSVISFPIFYDKVHRYYKQINELDRCKNIYFVNKEIVYNTLNDFYNKPIKLDDNIRRMAKYNLNILNYY